MFERVLNVKYIAEKHCFLHLPSSLKLSASDNCVKLTHNDHQHVCFSVYTPSVNVDEQYVGLNSLYAKAIGIQENDTVTVKEIDHLPTVKKINIVALNNEDYEVLELLSENIQATLLDQIRVVNAGQNIVIWVGNLNVVVFVEEVSPISPGILDFLSEVVIKPPAIVNSKSVCPSIDSSSNNVIKTNKFLNFFEEPHITEQDDDKLGVYKSNRSKTILRIVPIDNFPRIKDVSRKIYPFSMFSSKRNFTDTWLENSSEKPIFCSLTLLNSAVINSTVFVRLCFLEDYEVSCCGEQSNNIYVDDCIINLFKCDLGDRVLLKYITKYTYVKEIEIHGKKANTNLVEKVKQFLAANNEQPMILNSDIVLDIGNSTYVSFEFLPDKCKYCVIEGNFLREVKYSTVEVGLTRSEPSQVLPKTKGILEISNFQKIYEAVMTNYTTENKYFDFQNVLIIGKPGTGKSTILGIIYDQLREFPHFVRTETLQCKMLKGKTVDSLNKTFTELFNKLVHAQPSVLLLDDLHVLCEHVNVGEETPNSVYLNRVSEMIRCFIDKFNKYREIGVIATSDSISKLNGNIYKSRGSYIFKNLHSINNLNKKDRELLLNFLFEDTCKSYVSIDELATRTDGFVAQDLVDFYNKALFESYKDESADGIDDGPVITFDHCEKALKNTTALSLLNVKFNESCTKDFSDIGGLHDIKKVLVESLLWPTQYPTIFDDAPLRLQSGLLLYGPPGSGKTLLAGAAARHCRLRLIAVKGPELLSKYIGASEQAVRDIFERAQSARPCILFFDEFDSLAPRRGHDNTGVTDRVVNQLLTQLDGIESLSGVCVLAATSRPDLLDPALLRPGRLDRQLLCPMPDKEARLEILKVLSKNMNLIADVDLGKIASKTQGYSGADLQAILYTAQLSSVENIWRDDFKDFSEEGNVITTQITQQHIEYALRNTKPSLNDAERRKYERIYAQFQGKSVEDFKPGTRATLA